MMKTLASAALASLIAAGNAHAALVTETYDFSLSNFIDITGNATSPVSSLSGAVTITFDPTLNYNSQTTGISLTFNGTAPAIDSAIGFSNFPGSPGSTVLLIGGIYGGSNVVYNNTNDFVLTLDFTNGDYADPTLGLCNGPGITCGNYTGTQTVYSSGFTSTAYPNSAFFASVDSVITTTPLPGALPLLAGGLGLIGFITRRRKQNAAGLSAA